MKPAPKILISLGLTLLLVASAGTSSKANTTLSFADAKNCEQQFTIGVVLAFSDDGSAAKATELTTNWQKEINSYWNSSPHIILGGPCAVYYHFQLTTLPQAEDCTKSLKTGHCITVVSSALNRRGKIGDVLKANPQGKSWSYGEWTTSLSGVQVAYLAGHLLGLGNDFSFADVNKDNILEFELKNPAQTNPFSLMGKPFPANVNAAALPEHDAQIAALYNLTCPAACFCGNSKVDVGQGEMCDSKATPTGCKAEETCDQSCQCQSTPARCGDGKINPGEQCDPQASPKGCTQNQVCSPACLCIDLPANLQTQTTTPVSSPTTQVDLTLGKPHSGDGICEVGETCTSAYDDCKAVLNCPPRIQ